jgi:hypothetical protein
MESSELAMNIVGDEAANRNRLAKAIVFIRFHTCFTLWCNRSNASSAMDGFVAV